MVMVVMHSNVSFFSSFLSGNMNNVLFVAETLEQ